MDTALVIYDLTGKILAVYYGETDVPQGVPYLFVDIPEGESIVKVDLSDPKNPVVVLSGENKTDLTKLQEELERITTKVDENIPDKKIPETLEEIKAAKKQEIGQACDKIIYDGMDVTLTDGSTEHFSLTDHDQLNLFGKQVQLAAGTDQLEYHSDGQACRYYSAKDMQIITSTAMAYVSYHTTYCNAVNMWIAGCETTDEIQQIYYGADVPEQYQSDVLKAYIASMKEGVSDVDESQATEQISVPV